jgi:hypothetical protein
MEVKFKHVLAVRVAEFIRKADRAKWLKEWNEMEKVHQDRYNFILVNYDGFKLKKINKK